MKRVRIAGIDKIKLLEALWKNQQPAFFFKISGTEPPKFDKNHAREIFKVNKGYFDYFCGRRIKTDLSGDSADPRRYDDDPATGPGTFKKIVEYLKHD